MDFTLLSTNLNGLRSKKSELEACIAQGDLDAVLVQETKLGPKVPASDLDIFSCHSVLRKDRNESGGGVGIVVRDRHEFRRVEERETIPGLEIIAAQVLPPRPFPAITIVSVYRPPGGTAEEREGWSDKLSSFLTKVSQTSPIIIIAGDINLCLNNQESESFRATLDGLGFNLLNNREPTHRDRAIDFAAIRSEENAYCKARLDLEPTLERTADGHAGLRVSLSFPPPPQGPLRQPRFALRRCWKDADWSLAPPVFIPASGDVDVLHASLVTRVHQVTDLCVPYKRTRIGRRNNQPPWMSERILELITAHREKYKRWRRLRSAKARKAASKAKAVKRRAIEDAKRSYADAVIAEAEERSSLWEVYRRLRQREKRTVPDLEHGERLLQGDEEKAQALCATFAAAFTPPSDEDAAAIYELTTGEAAEVPPEALTTPTWVAKELSRLKKRKATGLDGISSRTLRALSGRVAAALCLLLNTILLSQTIPRAWKRCWVAPVPKKPNPRTPDDFRPISILDSGAKVMDKLLLRLIQPYATTSPRQFGFSARSGCGDALMRMQLDVLEVSEAGRKSGVTMVSLDARKAFDRVKHVAIIKALARNDAPRWLLRVVASWLKDRQFQVRVGQEGRSEWRSATSGAPQGAGLSAVLFRLAIDGVFTLNLHPGTRICGFADDLLVIRATPSREELRKLQEDLVIIQHHLRGIGLELNARKTQVLHASLSPAGHSPGLLRLGGEDLPEVSEMKYLGCIIDRRLSYGPHWARVASSAKSAVGALSRLVHRNPTALRHLYRERVSSVFLHSLPFIPPSTQQDWHRLNRVASFTGHLILNSWQEHGNVVTRMAGLTPPSQLCYEQTMRFVFKCVYGSQRYGSWIEHEPEPEHHLRRSQRMAKPRTGRELSVPRTHLRRWECLQPIRALVIFNSLPSNALSPPANSRLETISFRAFSNSLPMLYLSLSAELRKRCYGEL